jgi:hypothetical protein
MTAQGVVDAFVRGDLDRRGFITKLTALGVSASAASAYALTLGRQGAAAAPGSSTGGIARAHLAQEEDHDTAFVFETLEEALGLVFDAVNGLLATLGALTSFDADDFEIPTYFDILQTIADHKQDHAEALAALLGTTPVAPPTAESFGTSQDFLTELAGEYDGLTATYAAVVPAVGNGEARQTLMNVASVANRHAALINMMAGIDPLPEAFEVPEV